MTKKSKKDNVQRIATPAIRSAFSNLTISRQHKNEWATREENNKDAIRALTGNLTGVTYTTPDGIEVGSINESDPTQAIDYRALFESDYVQNLIKNDPALQAEVEKHRKPASTVVRILSKFIEADPASLQKKRPVRKTTVTSLT